MKQNKSRVAMFSSVFQGCRFGVEQPDFRSSPQTSSFEIPFWRSMQDTHSLGPIVVCLFVCLVGWLFVCVFICLEYLLDLFRRHSILESLRIVASPHWNLEIVARMCFDGHRSRGKWRSMPCLLVSMSPKESRNQGAATAPFNHVQNPVGTVQKAAVNSPCLFFGRLFVLQPTFPFNFSGRKGTTGIQRH